jgi:hypothetical protein
MRDDNFALGGVFVDLQALLIARDLLLSIDSHSSISELEISYVFEVGEGVDDYGEYNMVVTFDMSRYGEDTPVNLWVFYEKDENDINHEHISVPIEIGRESTLDNFIEELSVRSKELRIKLGRG